MIRHTVIVKSIIISRERIEQDERIVLMHYIN